MNTETTENGTATKTFISGLDVKAPRYWKDTSHFYKIININKVLIIYINDPKTHATIEPLNFENSVNFVIDNLMRSDRPYYQESSKKEFNQAKRLADKIINRDRS